MLRSSRLVGAELRLTDLRKQKVLADRNAQMGLMVAMGELQKHLGQDTRVTATADLLDERIEGQDETYSHDTPSSSGIDLNENGTIDPVPFGQRHWTGVWKHRADTKVSPRNYETGNAGHKETMYDSEFDGHPEAEVAWLVSGNEGHKKRLGLFDSGTGPLQDYLGIPDGISQTDRSNTGLGYGNAANAWEDYRQVVDSRLEDYDHPLKELPEPRIRRLHRVAIETPRTRSGLRPREPRRLEKTPSCRTRESSQKRSGDGGQYSRRDLIRN